MIESPLAEAIARRSASAWIKSYVKMVALGIGVQRQSRLVAGVGTLEFIATTVASFRTSRDGGSVMQKLESVTRRFLGLLVGRSVADEPPQGFFSGLWRSSVNTHLRYTGGNASKGRAPLLSI